jgi:hypothetical protein
MRLSKRLEVKEKFCKVSHKYNNQNLQEMNTKPIMEIENAESNSKNSKRVWKNPKYNRRQGKSSLSPSDHPRSPR